jgi:DNA methylase
MSDWKGDWVLYNGDMRDPVADYFPDVSLLLTDTPKLDWMPPSEIEKGLNKYAKFIKHGVVFVDDKIELDFPHILFPHSAYGKDPVPLIHRYIEFHTEEKDIVFDPFCGYSTVGICALIMKRRYIGVEINPDIYKISLERLESGAVSVN